MPKQASPHEDERLPAAVKLLGHTGAEEVQIRHSPEDEPPVTWSALGRWGNTWETASAMNPLLAVFRLCDQVIDGGQCTHCARPTGFVRDTGPVILDEFVCWYQWDPSRKEFRRGCKDTHR